MEQIFQMRHFFVLFCFKEPLATEQCLHIFSITRNIFFKIQEQLMGGAHLKIMFPFEVYTEYVFHSFSGRISADEGYQTP